MRFAYPLYLVFCFAWLNAKLFAVKDDSLKINNPAKHYFKTVIYADYYSANKQNLDLNNFYSSKLKSYQISQLALGFNTPLVTKDFYKKDSTIISNFHLLLSGSFVTVRPLFEGISDNHRLVRNTIGLKGIYNNGKKSLFFFEVSPFTTKDRGYRYTRTGRMASMFVYNCTVNKFFSFRVGYVRSFAFGNRYHLPYLGVRVGKLDGVNVSIQFPRSVSINVPIGRYFKASIYTKPQGGLYTMANTDSLYYLNNDKRINFGRYEFLSGFRLDVFPTNYFGFYLCGGISNQNHIGFYSDSYNRRAGVKYQPFYKEKLDNSMFINVGLVFKFGKVKSIYNNYNLYDAQDLNNKDGNGISQGNPQIPAKENKIKNIGTDDVQDLIETSDLY
jgi:hypothetical protein